MAWIAPATLAGRCATSPGRGSSTAAPAAPPGCGRARQITACLRGLWDGIRDRPLPLVALGLRQR
jgi:hypothetical protein